MTDYFETNAPFSSDNKINVHYEDLISNPALETKRIFKFLDIELSSSDVNHILANADFSLMKSIDSNFYREGLANASEKVLEHNVYNMYRRIISEFRLYSNAL